MEAKLASLDFSFVGYKFTGLFSEYAELITQGLRDIKEKSHHINNRLDKTVILYEPCKGDHHLIGSFYIGYIVTNEQEDLSDELELIRVNGLYAAASGTIDQMANIYSYINNWIDDSGNKPIWPDTLYIEIYETPLEPELTWREEVQVYLPVEQ